MSIIIFGGIFVAVALGVLAAARVAEEFSGGPHAPGNPMMRGLNACGLVVLVALMALLYSGARAEVMALFGLVALVVFAWWWVSEFLFLMRLRDDDFPGRFDKVVWAALMIVAAPVGLWTFRVYRAARWPAPAEKPAPYPGATAAAADLL